MEESEQTGNDSDLDYVITVIANPRKPVEVFAPGLDTWVVFSALREAIDQVAGKYNEERGYVEQNEDGDE